MDTSRLSACSISLIGRPREQAFGIIAAAGFQKVDLLGRLPHFSLDPHECDPEAVRSAATESGLRVANLGTYTGKGFAVADRAAQEQELALLRLAVDRAAFFGARTVRVSPGNDDPSCIDRIVPWFQAGAGYAASKGVYLGFENHGGGISGRPDLCLLLAQRVASPFFGVLFDPANLVLGGVDCAAALETLRSHIVHVHLKDAIHVDGTAQLCAFGQGEIDFVGIVRSLDAAGYTGDFALEYELRDEPAESALPKWYQAWSKISTAA